MPDKKIFMVFLFIKSNENYIFVGGPNTMILVVLFLDWSWCLIVWHPNIFEMIMITMFDGQLLVEIEVGGATKDKSICEQNSANVLGLKDHILKEWESSLL
jgi:hypothetical protein